MGQQNELEHPGLVSKISELQRQLVEKVEEGLGASVQLLRI